MAKLEQWIDAIQRQELPVFRFTIQAINEVVSDEDSSAARLARVILQDSSLTARILRIANSSAYNPGGTPVSTISRAIVLIGFDTVRDLSLTLAVFEALLGRRGREHVVRLMARAFHAAVQARACAERRGDGAAEEVFIAALLYPLGEMAFWCVAEGEGDEILALVEEQGMSPEAAQKQVLGFTFKQLTVALTRDWHLSDPLHSAINNPSSTDPRVRDISDGQALAEVAEQGWDSNAVRAPVERIADRLALGRDEAGEWLRDNAADAAELARLFGAGAITGYLPLPPEAQAPDEEAPPEENAEYPAADPLLQLSILRDLSRMLEKQPGIGLVLETVLEGIYRGCGMDRCLFAILTPDRSALRAKYALGAGGPALLERFRFTHADTPFFNRLYTHADAAWIGDTERDAASFQLTADLLDVLTTRSFFAFPLAINDKVIGVLYADRAPSGRDLDEDGFESFRHFCLQAKMALEYLAAK
ncbi:MAG: HDOD domain-containing protein [Pseudohaliea sp.]